MSQPFKKSIGIVGGGQLGKMLIESTQKWNVQYNVLDAADCPSAIYAQHFIDGKLTDVGKINQLASISDVITYEIEHINAQALSDLQNNGKQIIPSPEILKVIQDKGKQKQFYSDNGLPTTDFVLMKVEEIDSAQNKISKLKGDTLVVKSCTGGYDGKGVQICKRSQITSAYISQIFQGEILVEEFVNAGTELSVIVARNQKGELKTYPIVEMVFDPKINLVDYLFAPANIPNDVASEATSISIKAIEALNGVGLFAVELFLTQDGKIYINEIAPRPHNSGHHTIEACYTSQYEQLARVLLDMPLGETTLLSPAVMTNIIGPDGVSGSYNLEGMESLFSTPGAYLHWYNKAETRPGRKMGHFTVMNANLEDAIKLSNHIKNQLKIVAVD